MIFATFKIFTKCYLKRCKVFFDALTTISETGPSRRANPPGWNWYFLLTNKCPAGADPRSLPPRGSCLSPRSPLLTYIMQSSLPTLIYVQNLSFRVTQIWISRNFQPHIRTRVKGVKDKNFEQTIIFLKVYQFCTFL